MDGVTSGLLSEAEFSREINRKQRTIRRYITMALPTSRVGRSYYFDPAEAQQWFRGGMQPPKPPHRGGARRTA
jgi:hypothetical protein